MPQSPLTASFNEPSLDDLLAEPMIQQLMKRDGVHPRDMQYQLHRVQGRSQSFRPF